MINIIFGEFKNGKLITKATKAKMARGDMIWYMAKNHITVSQLATCSPEQVQEWLTFAVYYANYSITKSGAIASYPDYTTFVKWMQEKRKKAH